MAASSCPFPFPLVMLGKLFRALCLQHPYVRVIDIQQPVEAHVHAERNIDQIIVLLFQSIINSGQAVDDLQNIHRLVILLEVVLVQGIACSRQIQEIHCKNKETQWRLQRDSGCTTSIQKVVIDTTVCLAYMSGQRTFYILWKSGVRLVPRLPQVHCLFSCGLRQQCL